jgi:diadenosine tetraphosphate (Ap4A) HIT family hydrolase
MDVLPAGSSSTTASGTSVTIPALTPTPVSWHRESLSELTHSEAQALGPILISAVRAMEQVVQAERVYAVSFNERVRHVHFLLLPRTRAMPKGHVISDLYRRGRNLLRGAGLLRNPSMAARAEAADRIRQAWNQV